MSLDNLDTYRTIDLELDLANDYIEPVTLSAGDNEGRVIRVSLYNGTAAVDGSSYTARLLYNPQPQNPNSAGGYVTMTAVEGAPTATWTVSVPGSSLIPGVALMAIRVSEGDNVICTRTFDAIVESGVIHEGASETTSALSEFWEAVENIQQEIDAFAKELDFTASVDGTKWTETTPSVTVTQTTSEDKVDVDLAFHGIVGGEGFAWNILRGTNSGAALKSTSSWEQGTWRGQGNGIFEALDVTDAPVADIAHGWHIECGNTSFNYLLQNGIPLVAGETYVMSCYIRNGSIRLEARGSIQIYPATATNNTDKWVQMSGTFTATADYTGTWEARYYLYSGDGDAVDICGMKLELANGSETPTPWTVSPWDITPQLSMTASVDATSGTPSVEVTQDTSGNATAFDLAFSGLKGADGQGVPSGGSEGQLLVKQSSTDYDAAWSNVINRNDITIQTSEWAQSQTPLDSQYYTPTFRFYDADGVRIGYFCGRYYNSTDSLGISQYSTRTINGTEVTFGFTPRIASDGSLTLTFANTASMQAWQSALGINTLSATVAALADTTATLAAAHDADADAICALYVDLIHHDVRDIDSVPDAYRAQVTQQLELDGDDWQDPYVDDDDDRAIAPSEPLPLSDDTDAGE